MHATPGRGGEEASREGSPLLRAISDAILTAAAEHRVEPVLQKLVHSARDLAAARYAAIGVPDGAGTFAKFLTSGMSAEAVAAIGPLPRTHGLLGAMLETPVPYRTSDIKRDPRFWGWPRAHPDMSSFLGVPIVSKGTVIGAFYLTNKEVTPEFSDSDQRLIELLAAHAAIAIENARLHERSRELSVVEERNRLARELHDSVTQRLFGVAFAADAAARLLDRDREEAGRELNRVRDLARDAMQELRSLVFELRTADLEAEGLATTLGKHVDILRRAYGRDVDLTVEGEPRLEPARALEVFRVAQEALTNAIKHSDARAISVHLIAQDGRIRLRVADDGVGFDPRAPVLRARRLGLTSMEERAAGLGGSLTIRSRPGEGTLVSLELADG
jgi:signal transduction histidine kinase